MDGVWRCGARAVVQNYHIAGPPKKGDTTRRGVKAEAPFDLYQYVCAYLVHGEMSTGSIRAVRVYREGGVRVPGQLRAGYRVVLQDDDSAIGPVDVERLARKCLGEAVGVAASRMSLRVL